MVSRTLRIALLVGAVTAAVVSPAVAQHRAPCCNEPCGAPAACAPAQCAPAPAPAAPQYRTITVTECVPQTYTEKRTCYRYECRTEMVNSFKTVCVPECRERVCTVTERVPCVTTQMRKVCKTVTCYEQRTVMKNCYQTVQETVCRKHCVRLGHWECRETCSHGLFGGGHGGGNCCDPCANQCCTTRTRRVWVHCPEYEYRPHTVCKRVCTQVPTTCQVKVCKQVWSEVPVQVCTYQCVQKQVVQKYTCMVSKQVPCQVCRTVRVCVPYETTVTCCKMVPVQKQIQVAVCQPACQPTCCETTCGHRGLFRRGHGHGGCGSSCGTGCCN
jgi:hypothetical protein